MIWTVSTYAGRALIALLFILAGIAKVTGPKPFLDHMAQHNVPGGLLPLVALLEVGGGLLVLSGWQARWAGLALAAFCVATAFVFHLDWTDKAERTLFFKDLAIAGGLLTVAALSARAKGSI
ncbi:DoxX family protein [Phenylobacterium sp.]|uniref:DoxX family protein n=1 Tax=Phenylobacterium sp. TaxID=1871053 RepID=UPI00120C7246|nr:DoxX family protein [Phenylobacterium sp.]THD57836.1 MAG: DoxX family protein [Phenylobacterium sp.]